MRWNGASLDFIVKECEPRYVYNRESRGLS